MGLSVISLAEVRLQEGESLENALRRFKRKVQTEEIIDDVKRHTFYLKRGCNGPTPLEIHLGPSSRESFSPGVSCTSSCPNPFEVKAHPSFLLGIRLARVVGLRHRVSDSRH